MLFLLLLVVIKNILPMGVKQSSDIVQEVMEDLFCNLDDIKVNIDDI